MKFDALILDCNRRQQHFGTEARKQVVNFSDQYHTQGAIIVVPADSPIKSLPSLRKKQSSHSKRQRRLRRPRSVGRTGRATAHPPANMQFAMKTDDVAAMIYDPGILAYQSGSGQCIHRPPAARSSG